MDNFDLDLWQAYFSTSLSLSRKYLWQSKCITLPEHFFGWDILWRCFDWIRNSNPFEWMQCDSVVASKIEKNRLQFSTWLQVIDVSESSLSLQFNWIELDMRFIATAGRFFSLFVFGAGVTFHFIYSPFNAVSEFLPIEWKEINRRELQCYEMNRTL